MRGYFPRALALQTIMAACLAAGFGSGTPYAAVVPVAPTPPAAPVPASQPVALQGDLWDLTSTLRSVAGDVCGIYAPTIGRSIDWIMVVERTATSVRLLYDVRNYPTDHVEYASPLTGDAFEGVSTYGFGWPQRCGGRQYQWSGSGHVAGQFSADGRTISGREEWNYATASGDEQRLFFDWTATKR